MTKLLLTFRRKGRRRMPCRRPCRHRKRNQVWPKISAERGDVSVNRRKKKRGKKKGGGGEKESQKKKREKERDVMLLSPWNWGGLDWFLHEGEMKWSKSPFFGSSNDEEEENPHRCRDD